MRQSLPQDLRNKSFRGKNCEGWDFSGRDIRGCDFRNARLDGANFSSVITGQTRKKICIYLLTLGVFTIVGVLIRAIAYGNEKAGTNGFTLTMFTLMILCYVLPYSLLIEASYIGLVLGIWTCATVYMMWITLKTFIYIMHHFWYEPILYLILELFLTILFLWIIFHFARYIHQIFQDNTGTNFQGTDLQSLNLQNATFRNSKFDGANQKNFNLNLNYKVHDDTNIQRVNLSDANLSRSILQDLNLSFTNLTNINATGTIFCRTILTGACIRGWTIDSNTQFDQVICEYIYLSAYRTPTYRIPKSGNFKPGEFEEFLRKQSQMK